jgi:hypothetical protein
MLRIAGLLSHSFRFVMRWNIFFTLASFFLVAVFLSPGASGSLRLIYKNKRLLGNEDRSYYTKLASSFSLGCSSSASWANTFSAAANVLVISLSACAAETKPTSKADGAK